MYDLMLKVHTIFGGKMKVIVLLKQIREERRISLEELAKLSGISKSHLSYIERQEKEPTLTILVKIAKALNIDIKDLYKVEW